MKKIDLSEKSLKQLQGRINLYKRKLQLALIIKNRPDNIQKQKIKAYQAEIIRVDIALAEVQFKKDDEEFSSQQQTVADLERKLISDRLTKKPLLSLNFSGSVAAPSPVGSFESSALSFNWQDSMGGGF
jgi:hypothetical protein